MLSIKDAGVEKVYDLTEPKTSSFIANGLIVHNCSESILLDKECCVLGSINLLAFVDREARVFDFGRMARVINTATRFLDNVIDVQSYPSKEIEDTVKRYRKIGLGFMGLHDTLLALGYGYETTPAERIIAEFSAYAKEASVALATERGPFPAFGTDATKAWFNNKYQDSEGIGRRNASVTTVAPTGTLSIILGVSSGIEPIYALTGMRKYNDKEGKLQEIHYRHPLFQQLLSRVGEKDKTLRNKLYDKALKTGVISDIDGFENWRTATEITADEHLHMLAMVQQYIEQGVSKTINLDHSATEEVISNTLLRAWELKVKAVAMYRNKSRVEQVYHLTKDAGGDTEQPGTAPTSSSTKDGKKEDCNTGCGRLHTFVTLKEGTNEPSEVFSVMGRAGGCAAAQMEGNMRLSSLALKKGATLIEIADQYSGIRCDRPVFHEGRNIPSCISGIAFNLTKISENLTQGQDVIPEPSEKQKPVKSCPKCSTAMTPTRGCHYCPACGFSECSG